MYNCPTGDLLLEVHPTSEEGKTSQDGVVSGGRGELQRMKRVIVSKFNYLFLILEKFYLTVFMKDYIHNINLFKNDKNKP